MASHNDNHQSQEEAPIHGDTLESVLTHVPLIHLVPACHVSKSWKRAVLSSLRHLNPIKPWLLLHAQRTRPPHSITTRAYDPRSRLWIQVTLGSAPVKHISALRSSHSNLLYMLSPSKFSFSFDSLHLTWHDIDPPIAWRKDPIVAVVGNYVVVAGGAWEFEDDPLAVEIYDMERKKWEAGGESLPAAFKDCTVSLWLSVAASKDKMYVVEKSSGVAHWFDPVNKTWHGPYNLSNGDHGVCCSVIGFCNGRLILVATTVKENERVEGVKVWGLNDESLELSGKIGEMPRLLVESLDGGEGLVASIAASFMGDCVYIWNSQNPEEVILCEICGGGGGGGGGCRWSSERNVAVNDTCRLTERLVFTCSNVGLGDLHRAMMLEDNKFCVLDGKRERLI